MINIISFELDDVQFAHRLRADGAPSLRLDPLLDAQVVVIVVAAQIAVAIPLLTDSTLLHRFLL